MLTYRHNTKLNQGASVGFAQITPKTSHARLITEIVIASTNLLRLFSLPVRAIGIKSHSDITGFDNISMKKFHEKIS